MQNNSAADIQNAKLRRKRQKFPIFKASVLRTVQVGPPEEIDFWYENHRLSWTERECIIL